VNLQLDIFACGLRGWVGIRRLLNAFFFGGEVREDNLVGTACEKKWLKDNGFSHVSFPPHPPSSN